MPFGDTTITLAANLTAGPELRYTATEVALAAFTVAASRHVYDAESGQWRDGETLFLRCPAWHLTGHVAESLTKGTRVVVTGRLRQRAYETTDGRKRTAYEVDADDAGPSLRFATAKVTKTTREPPRTRPGAQPAGGSASPSPPARVRGPSPPSDPAHPARNTRKAPGRIGGLPSYR